MLYKILSESSLSRIFQHIQSGNSFAVISAFLGKYTNEQNLGRHVLLAKEIRKLGYGYIEQESGYSYTDPGRGTGTVEEKSYFIPKISFKQEQKL